VFDTLDLTVGTEVLPEVVPSWKTCGRVTSDAATETGLAAGTPVASGLHDVGATALGTGAHRPGQGVLIVGTWGQSIVVTDDPYADKRDGGLTVDGTDGDETDDDPPDSPGLTRRYLDGYLRYKGLRSAATCLDWFVTEFGDQWRRRAGTEGISPYEIYNQIVADVPAGADGLLFHPYLDGSTDAPTDRGGFYGLTSEHTKATMLRAVYEGVALSQAARLAELAPTTGLTDVRLSGGGARSEVWSDIFAAAVDKPLFVPVGEEAGARGAAVCGALAAGVYADHDSAVDRMVAVDRRHDPDADTAALYRDRRETFEGALEAIRPTWKRLMADPESDSMND